MLLHYLQLPPATIMCRPHLHASRNLIVNSQMQQTERPKLELGSRVNHGDGRNRSLVSRCFRRFSTRISISSLSDRRYPYPLPLSIRRATPRSPDAAPTRPSKERPRRGLEHKRRPRETRIGSCFQISSFLLHPITPIHFGLAPHLQSRARMSTRVSRYAAKLKSIKCLAELAHDPSCQPISADTSLLRDRGCLAR